tara:strand:+ start:448 stop:552 length:105 start_codon:yes stop_codon:yes gene_type:complete
MDTAELEESKLMEKEVEDVSVGEVINRPLAKVIF